MDVVPPGDLSQWKTDPYTVVEKDGKLYGRGVEDNQQGLVSGVFAALAYVKQHILPEHTIKLLFMADEEVGSAYGMIYLVNKYPELFAKNDLILIPDGGDPKGETIEVAEKSFLIPFSKNESYTIKNQITKHKSKIIENFQRNYQLFAKMNPQKILSILERYQKIEVKKNEFIYKQGLSKKGIIIKGSSYFDKLAKVKTLAMDKTGTLTYGNFQVTEWHVVKGEQKEFISYLQAAESRSNHPIARAIVGNAANLANEQNNYEEIAGKGIKTEWNGHTILAGNLSLLNDNGISAEISSNAGTLVYLAVDGEYYGYAVLNDVVRKESKPLIDKLHKLGIKTCLLTGDKKERAEEIGNSLGIDEIHSELLPNEKVEVIKSKLNDNNGMVAYVGDGINDAPSLALADVGCAMGGVGSDTAIEAADVVFMNDDPSRFVTAVKLAKICKRRAVGLIAFALAVKVGIMIASIICSSVGAIFPLWIAVLGDTGLTVQCVFLTLTINFEMLD